MIYVKRNNMITISHIFFCRLYFNSAEILLPERVPSSGVLLHTHLSTQELLPHDFWVQVLQLLHGFIESRTLRELVWTTQCVFEKNKGYPEHDLDTCNKVKRAEDNEPPQST